MNKLAIEKLELLLNDLEINKKREQETGRGYFTTELFMIRVREILKILMEKKQ